VKCVIVVLQVFGGTVICRDLEVATTISRSSEVDCITLDGTLLACPPFGSIYNSFRLLG
jgi:chromosome segregation ATPase